LRNNWPGRPWIKPNSAISPKPWAAIVFPPEARKPKGVLNACGRREQSRLPVWFALNGIAAREQANASLPRFITGFNQRFHRNPACRNETAFAPLPAGTLTPCLPPNTTAKRILAAASPFTITPSRSTAPGLRSKNTSCFYSARKSALKPSMTKSTMG
jgi:hypothetical protein